MLSLNKDTLFKGFIVLWGLLLMTIAYSSSASADAITTTESYNPTEPEVQLGDVTELGVDESGAVKLDDWEAQGNLDESAEVIIDGVKGKDKIYYILEKGGDIISVHVENGKIVGADDSSVKVVDVDVIHGNNGTADKDGFKSNIVPEGILPKTGLAPDSPIAIWLVLGLLGLLGVSYGFYRKMQEE